MHARAMIGCLVVAMGCGGAGGAGGDAGGGDGGTGDDGALVDGGPVSATLTTYVGGRPNNLAFVAGQDGDGPWVALDGDGGRYQIEATSGRFGFAYACGDQDASSVGVILQSASDGREVAAGCRGAATHRVSGSTDAFDGRAIVGPTESDYFAGTFTAFVPQGTWDLATWEGSETDVAGLLVRRGLVVNADLAIELSFESDGIAPIDVGLEVQGLDESCVVRSALLMAGGGALRFPNRSTTGAVVGTASLAMPPASMLAAGDVVMISAGDGERTATVYQATPADLTLSLPPESPITARVEGGAPYVRWQVEFPPYPDGRVHDASWYQLGGASFRQRYWALRVSEAWLTASGARTVVTPDLSTSSGWTVDYQPLEEGADWTAHSWRSNRGTDGILELLDGQATLRTPPGLAGLVMDGASAGGPL